MKYTIEGFSQEYAISLKKNVPTKDGKEKLIKIDCTDLVILRWFVDFYPNMKKMTVDGKEYAWLAHSKMLDDIPLLDISKRACIERMQKLVEFGILQYKLIKEGGTFSLYTFGENYMNLVRSNDMGVCSTEQGVYVQPTQGGVHLTDTGECSQPNNKDNSISNTSIIDKSIKDSFKEIILNYAKTIDVSVRADITDLLFEWLKVRKAKRAAMTDRAIQMNIDKLNNLAEKSGMTVKDYLSEVICRGWAAFYEIKMYGNNANQKQQNAPKEPQRFGGTYL